MRTPFKQRSSPVKGKLQNFFNSVGEELRAGQKERGIFSEKGKAEKKEMRKTGESKYQFDVGKRREAKKLKPGEFSTKRKLEGDLVVNQELMNKKVDKSKNDSGSESDSGSSGKSKIDWTKAPKVGTTARTDWYKKFNLALDDTTKISPYKKGISKNYTRKPKGSRGFKMKK